MFTKLNNKYKKFAKFHPYYQYKSITQRTTLFDSTNAVNEKRNDMNDSINDLKRKIREEIVIDILIIIIQYHN